MPALTVMAATAVTRLRLNFPAVTAALGAGQLVLHEVFTAFHAPGQAGTAAPADAHHLSGQLPPFVNAVHSHAVEAPAGVLMPPAHALATAMCALLLAKGETSLWALAAWLRPLVRLPQAVTPDAGPPPAVPGPPAAIPYHPWRNHRQHSRRGPPAVVALPDSARTALLRPRASPRTSARPRVRPKGNP